MWLGMKKKIRPRYRFSYIFLAGILMSTGEILDQII